MSKQHIGKLPPRYKFLLNPHEELKLSSCPYCKKPTHPRKFALFIHVDDWGPYTQGKTCKYCSTCDLIICHQVELEAEMARAFVQLNPKVIGSEYMVIGTVAPKAWKAVVQGRSQTVQDILTELADFKEHLFLGYDPGGWRKKDADPEAFTISHATAAARLVTPWRRNCGENR